MTSARTYGIEAELLTPAEVKKLVPFINEDIILGGYYTPSVSCVDSLQMGTLMREEAVNAGVRRCSPTPRCATSRPRPSMGLQGSPPSSPTKAASSAAAWRSRWRVEPAHRRWRRQHPAHARRPPDGRRRADRRPARDERRGRLPDHPRHGHVLLRAPVGGLDGGRLVRPPAIFHHPDDIPSNEESPLSPTELPLTYDDFDPQMEQAIDLMEMLGDAEIKYAINGLLSLTPDAMPVLGETPRCATSGRPPRCGSRKGRASPSSSPSGWSTATRDVRPARVGHRPLLRAREDRAPHLRPLRRALQQDLRHRAPRAMGDPARHAAARSTPARKRSAPCSTTPAGGSARSGTSRTPT